MKPTQRSSKSSFKKSYSPRRPSSTSSKRPSRSYDSTEDAPRSKFRTAKFKTERNDRAEVNPRSSGHSYGRPADGRPGSRFVRSDSWSDARPNKFQHRPKNRVNLARSEFAGIPDRSLPSPALIERAPTALNAYISQAGVCSRRKAVDMIKQGMVTVNGLVVSHPGYRVQADDNVKIHNSVVGGNQSKVYILLNKPKDYITTLSDEKDRKTVMELVADAAPGRIYPVGRLDRQTTGLLLMTNDGQLAQLLSHPRNNVSKVYQVALTQPFKREDLEKLRTGVDLEDGTIAVDAADYARGYSDVVTVTIHSGKNRVVRRMFEALGYEIYSLDRISYAGLTKKDLLVGKWRALTAHEVRMLRK